MPMVTRTRRARARYADMQMDSDVDMDAEEQGRIEEQDNDDEDDEGLNVDIEAVAEGEGEDDDGDTEEGDEDEDDAGDEDDDDQEDEIQSDAEAARTSSTTKASGSRLKIRLKIPKQSSSRYETPVVESEDSMSDSQPSTNRPMTARQAVLASVVDSSHVSLTGSRQKKAPLNETELALRREETARKRRNLTEKKLEDEKAETINRLLKKQSRPRNKRTTAQRESMDDVAPSSMAGTRSNSNSTNNQSVRKKALKKSVDQDAGNEEDGMDEDNEDDEQPEREVPIPTMYRWVSTSRIPPSQEGEASTEGRMRITFSVPTSVLSLPEAGAKGLPDAIPTDEKPLRASTRPTQCGVPGCTNPFRYRLVKDWTRGACGISCLKLLESRMDTAT